MITINQILKNNQNQYYKNQKAQKTQTTCNNMDALSQNANLLVGMPASILMKVYFTGNKNISFKGQLEDDFHKAAIAGDVARQLRSLSNLQFNISEVDIETGNNFLHAALKSQNKQLINKALLLLGQKTANDKELAKTIVNRSNNDNKKPYDYTTDSNILSVLGRITGEELASNISELSSTPPVKSTENTESTDALNKLPEGIVIKIPSFDDEDEEINEVNEVEVTEPLQKTEISDDFSTPLLSGIAGLNKAKKLFTDRIVTPLTQNKQVKDSGFLIYGTSGNGKGFLLKSLAKSLDKEIITSKKLEQLVETAINNSKDDKEKANKKG